MRVSLVFDLRFGERAAALMALGPVWMIDSDENTAAARKLRAREDGPRDLTMFRPGHTLSGLLPVVDLHHPDWRAIDVYGASLSAAEIDALDLGPIARGEADGHLVLSRPDGYSPPPIA
jgi:hypothetical protein